MITKALARMFGIEDIEPLNLDLLAQAGELDGRTLAMRIRMLAGTDEFYALLAHMVGVCPNEKMRRSVLSLFIQAVRFSIEATKTTVWDRAQDTLNERVARYGFRMENGELVADVEWAGFSTEMPPGELKDALAEYARNLEVDGQMMAEVGADAGDADGRG